MGKESNLMFVQEEKHNRVTDRACHCDVARCHDHFTVFDILHAMLLIQSWSHSILTLNGTTNFSIHWTITYIDLWTRQVIVGIHTFAHRSRSLYCFIIKSLKGAPSITAFRNDIYCKLLILEEWTTVFTWWFTLPLHIMWVGAFTSIYLTQHRSTNICRSFHSDTNSEPPSLSNVSPHRLKQND